MRLTPRRPIGVLGLWHVGPGASRAASLQIVQAMNGWHPPHRPRRCGCLVRGSLDPGARSASSVSSRLLAAPPANRILPTCFGPGPARLPTHPTSTTPTTRHDLASVQRTGEIRMGVGDEGDKMGADFLPVRGAHPPPALPVPSPASGREDLPDCTIWRRTRFILGVPFTGGGGWSHAVPAWWRGSPTRWQSLWPPPSELR